MHIGALEYVGSTLIAGNYHFCAGAAVSPLMGKVALALCRLMKTRSKPIATDASHRWPRQDVQILHFPDHQEVLPKPIILPILKPIVENVVEEKRQNTPTNFVSPPQLVLWNEDGELKFHKRNCPSPEYMIDQALQLSHIGSKKLSRAGAVHQRKLVQPILHRFAREKTSPLGLLPVRSPVSGLGSCNEVRGRSTFSPGHPLLKELRYLHGHMSYPYRDFVPDWSTPKPRNFRRKTPPPEKRCVSDPIPMMAAVRAPPSISKRNGKVKTKNPCPSPSWANTNHEISAWGDDWHECQAGNTFSTDLGAMAQHLSGVEIWNCLNDTQQ